MALSEVTQDIYEANFQTLYQYFRDEVHNQDQWAYELVDIPHSWIKLCELVAATDTVIFRVMLKATYDNLYPPQNHPRYLPELSDLLNPVTQRNLTAATSYQICFIQMDADNIPVNAILYTYSGHDESYHTIALQ